MIFLPQSIPDVFLIKPTLYVDSRGFFAETYRQDLLNKAVGQEIKFLQDNESKSTKGVVRGLHYQISPYAQTKLVRVTNGRVLDVVVDIRRASQTFGNYLSFELSEDNKQQLFIPKGFAHGFVALSDFATLSYKVDNFYSPKHERGFAYDDPDLDIDWHFSNSILDLSERDLQNSTLANSKDLFE